MSTTTTGQVLRLSWLHLARDFRKVPWQITQLFHYEHRAGRSPFRSQTLTNQFITDLQHAWLVIRRYFRFLPFSKFIFEADPKTFHFPIRVAPSEIVVWKSALKRTQRGLFARCLKRFPLANT